VKSRVFLASVVACLALAWGTPVLASPEDVPPPSSASLAVPPTDDVFLFVRPAYPDAPQTTPRGTEKTSLVALFEQLDARGGTWYRGEDNEVGRLAWGESYVLLAYLEMYDATGETRYLDAFVTHADDVLARTDETLGVTDWAGRSGPVWRAGARYGFAYQALRAGDGSVIGTLTACRSGLNDQTYVSVLRGSRAGTFSLLLTNGGWGVREEFNDLSPSSSSTAWWVRALGSRSRLVKAASSRPAGDRALPLLSSPATFTPYRISYPVHSGLLALPLARFARVVSGDATLGAAYGTAAARYLTAAERALASHEPQWVQEGDAGYYRAEPGSPWLLDGVGLPYNQNLAVGRAFLELWRATGTEAHRARALAIGRHFKAGLSTTRERGYVWRYWWGQAYTGWSAGSSPSSNTPVYAGMRGWEDVGHAAVDVDFVCDVADVPSGLDDQFTDADVARLANTLNLQMRSGSLFLNKVRDGSTALQQNSRLMAARWMNVGHVSRDTFDALVPVVRNDLLEVDPFGQGLYAAALAAAVEKGYERDPGSRAATAPAVRLVRPGVRVPRGWVAAEAACGPTAVATELYIDGRSPWGLREVGPGSWLVDTRALKGGYHRFEVVTRDAIGRARRASRLVAVPELLSRPALVTRMPIRGAAATLTGLLTPVHSGPAVVQIRLHILRGGVWRYRGTLRAVVPPGLVRYRVGFVPSEAGRWLARASHEHPRGSVGTSPVREFRVAPR
jgi:hypothetical protein